MERLNLSVGCLDGSESVHEDGLANVSLPICRRRIPTGSPFRKSWSPSDLEDGNQEFWASIQESYNFIMDSQLIPESYQGPQLDSTYMEVDPCWEPHDSPTSEWGYSDFLGQYNELYEWLIQIQLNLYSHTNPLDKFSRIAQQEEMNKRSFKRQLFVKEGERLALQHPTFSEEISWRVNYLNTKWEQLITSLTPKKGHTNDLQVELDLVHEEDLLSSWLTTMEAQIQPLTCRLPKGSSVQALQERYKDNQVLLKDIDAHGPVLKSVIRQYLRRATDGGGDDLTYSSGGAANCLWEEGSLSSAGAKVPRRVKSLEKRWHQVYLRSLEWHYYLEGAIANFKDHPQSCSSSESDDDEPANKCRRLSRSSPSTPSSSPSLSEKDPPPHSRTNGLNDQSDYSGSYIEDDYLDAEIGSQVFECERDAAENTNMKSMKEHRDKSILTDVRRPSANFGVFEFRHNDSSDSDEYQSVRSGRDDANGNDPPKEEVDVSRRYKRTPARFLRASVPYPKLDLTKYDEEVDHDALQAIIDSAILDQNWLNSNLTSDSESLVSANEILDNSGQMLGVDGHHSEDVIYNLNENVDSVPLIRKDPFLSCSRPKESITKLISDVDNLVTSSGPDTPPSKAERGAMKPLSFEVKPISKRHRIRQWLSMQKEGSSSCDASGELTTGESDLESEASRTNQDSASVRRSCGEPMGSSENTPTAECLPDLYGDSIPKVARRGRKRTQNDQRPWSITELKQLALNNSSASRKPEEEPQVSPLSKSISFSSSETASNPVSTCSGHSSDTLEAATSVCLSPPKSTAEVTVHLSPVLTPSDSLKRRHKFRRRSLKYLGRRSESGSEKQSRGVSRIPPSPYHLPFTIPFSTESESDPESPGISGKLSPAGKGCLEPRAVDCTPLPAGNCTPRLNPLDLHSPRTSLTSDNEAITAPEDASSLSEQAWDPYQEFKYLSEPYSEDVDHDGARRLLDFGDDYRKYIDSDCSSLWLPSKRRRSPHQRRLRQQVRPRPSVDDSDSDMDDLIRVMEESKAQLKAVENILKNSSSEAIIGSFTLDFGKLLMTTKTNVACLQETLKHLQNEALDLKEEFKEVEGIVKQWKDLESVVLEKQRQSGQLLQLQKEVKSLWLAMEEIGDRYVALTHPPSMADPSEFQLKVEKAHNLLEETERLKGDLSNLNVLAHRFSVDLGLALSPLKDEVADLYRILDERQRSVMDEISRLDSAQATWRLWQEQMAQLKEALQKDSETLKVIGAAIDTGKITESLSAAVHDMATLLNERRKNPTKEEEEEPPLQHFAPVMVGEGGDDGEGHLSDSGTSGYESCSSDDFSKREKSLAHLKRLARDLEANLVPGSKTSLDIYSALTEAEKELKALQARCQNLLKRSGRDFNSGALKYDLPFSDPPRTSSVREDKIASEIGRWRRRSQRRGWIGRVVRAAAPFQVALLLLLCVACLLQPNCCDSINTLNLSLTPQLRYVHGEPPV